MGKSLGEINGWLVVVPVVTKIPPGFLGLAWGVAGLDKWLVVSLLGT